MPYAELGGTLRTSMGNHSQRWLAERTFVSPVSVCDWFFGRTRPAPWRLGILASLLRLDPDRLACLAGYDDDPSVMDKLMVAYGAFTPSPEEGDE